MKWYKIAGIRPSAQPFIKRVKAGSKIICLVGHDGNIYALSATCPHAGGDLSQGFCNNGKLVCPFHRYSYDLITGKGSEGQHDYVQTFPVEIKDETIYIGIFSLWERFKQASNT